MVANDEPWVELGPWTLMLKELPLRRPAKAETTTLPQPLSPAQLQEISSLRIVSGAHARHTQRASDLVVRLAGRDWLIKFDVVEVLPLPQ